MLKYTETCCYCVPCCFLQVPAEVIVYRSYAWCAERDYVRKGELVVIEFESVEIRCPDSDGTIRPLVVTPDIMAEYKKKP